MLGQRLPQPEEGKAVERTLILIKPDALARGLTGRILSRFEDKGLKIVGIKMMSLDDAVLREHYSHLADKPLVIAHRGASAHAPENTVPAIAKAVEMKADAIELDVQATRDDVPVCFHDVKLDRITGSAKRVKKLTMDELAAVEFLLNKMQDTKTNAQFFEAMKK